MNAFYITYIRLVYIYYMVLLMILCDDYAYHELSATKVLNNFS